MTGDADRAKLEKFMDALGVRVRGPGTIYLTGGATALIYGWREKTIDLDVKADPEPAGFFEAIAELRSPSTRMSSWPVRIFSFPSCPGGGSEAF